ncbi:hypothetical protein THAOC_02192 [Thalassiosira oceanica]|uniref:Helicase-associated domain-containing protein n=1 Tax=Thalassiosira oceanica TaxID=159749 RepID=K0TMB8_THAOC|nr:hypothetical protein THAOC_02192 [Thalassiosira oceanica]|eukprot:EJK76066.1 hypothetical protein THAOC_02192 [Thalassiosira oceanica]
MATSMSSKRRIEASIIFVRTFGLDATIPAGKGMKITDKQVRALDEIGFPWRRIRAQQKRTSSRGVSDWKMITFEAMLEDLRQHGHFNVKFDEDKSLHYFCQNLCFGRNHPDESMKITDQRAMALDEIGFPWGGRPASGVRGNDGVYPARPSALYTPTGPLGRSVASADLKQPSMSQRFRQSSICPLRCARDSCATRLSDV